MKPSTQYSAFISYASENREKAEAICAGLESRGLVCWIAPRDVRAGREYADEIILGLERSAAVVLVLSEAANTSVFVLREVERAVSKEINVVPVRIEEVTPSPGLELFISGTHWMDVWRGDWDDHMNRLVRDLSDAPAGPAPVVPLGARRSGSQPSSLNRMYVAAGLAIGVAMSVIGIWALSTETPSREEAPASQELAIPAGRTATPGTVGIERVPTTTAVQTPNQIQASAAGRGGSPEAATNQPSAALSVPEAVQLQADATRPGGRRVGGLASGGLTTRRSPAAQPAAANEGAAPPQAVEMSSALDALQDDYDKLSNRAGVIDDTLNQLWEEMKPNSPRIDMVTHQRSLRTNLTRTRNALANRNVAAVRRNLENAQADLAALEQFLNR